jgi:membrane-associated protease RseP (regulator of RpoE activity)
VAIEVTRAGASQKLSATIGEGRLSGMRGGGPGGFHLELPEPPEPPEPAEPGVAPHAPHPPRAFQWRFDGDEDSIFRMLPHSRPRLGVTFVDVGEQLAAYFKLAGSRGVLVTSVADGSPAAKAGVKAGDIVLELAGHKIKDGGDLREAVAEADAGQELALEVQRDGRPLELKVTLAKPETRPHAEAGVKL